MSEDVIYTDEQIERVVKKYVDKWRVEANPKITSLERYCNR